MGRWVTLKEGALALGISEITLKRRLKSGQIPGKKEQAAKGFQWFAELPDNDVADQTQTGQSRVNEAITLSIQTLREQLEQRTLEVARLQQIIYEQTQTMQVLTSRRLELTEA